MSHSSGWIVYLSESCGHCKTQRSMLRPSDKFILFNREGNIIDGYTISPPHLYRQLDAFPLWYNIYTREVKKGVHDPKKLH